jgi:hypothetical protein
MGAAVSGMVGFKFQMVYTFGYGWNLKKLARFNTGSQSLLRYEILK